MSRSTEITPEKIMQLTNNGYDIFNWELSGIPKKNIPSPLRSGDTNPSFQVKQSKSGMWIGVDYGGSQWKGNAISFIQERYALSFPEALNKIVQDLGLKEKSRVYKPIVKNIQPKIKDYVPNIEFNETPFSNKGAVYWNSYHLPADFLQANNVFEVGLWAIDKKIQKKTEDEVVFAYVPKDLDNKVKILRIGPNVPKEDKWRTNIPNNYLWSYWRYVDSPVQDLFVAKSYKDELVLRFLGYNVISVQSENSNVLLTSGNVDKINKIASNPIIVYGADPQGFKTSYQITKATGWDYFNIGRNYYKLYELEDPADFVQEFGMEPLKTLIDLKLGK